MRLHLFTTRSVSIIPFNYQPMLTGALHKWIGKNKIHDGLSLYSFSWLSGGTPSPDGLNFNQGARFFISAYDNDVLKQIIKGIQIDPEISNEFSVREVIIQEDPKFKNETTFYAASPVFVKRRIEKHEKHFTYDDPKSDQLLTETLQHKLQKVGLAYNDVSVEFDRNYQSPKKKVIYYNKIGNRVNLCPVRIKGSPEQITFAWNVGVGNSTGIGFGALR